jgi:catechol 2,3-dioxygenase-like lactoylglutathione lyase family enzyme
MNDSSSRQSPRELSTAAVSPSQLAHLVLRTPQYERTRDFYLKLLDAKVAFADELATFLRYDAEHHRLVIVNTPYLQPPEVTSAGLAHFAFTYPSLETLLGTYLRLKRDGIHPCWCINHGFTTSIYYYDPDGVQVETQYDNMPTEAADEFMRSSYFARNPIGVDFDPDLLVERFRRGDPMAELIKQGSAPFPPDREPVRPRRKVDYDYRGALLESA